jgi:hypothetical protein
LKRTGSAAHGATSAVSAATGVNAIEGVGDQVQEATGTVGDVVEGAAGGGPKLTLREELRGILRETVLDVLAPVARRATTQAAKYAITKAPQVARDTIAPKLIDSLGAAIEEAGGPEAFARGWLGSLADARAGFLQKVRIGRESQARPWQERRLPVEESIDVVVPLETAYDRFGEFEEYASFMSRGEIVDERPNERIVWETIGGPEATAVITFHRLSDRLTRVMLTYDDGSRGLVGKTTALFRNTRRGLTADMMRFKAFVEMEEEGKTPGRQTEEPPARAEADEKEPRPASSRASRRPPGARRGGGSAKKAGPRRAPRGSADTAHRR